MQQWTVQQMAVLQHSWMPTTKKKTTANKSTQIYASDVIHGKSCVAAKIPALPLNLMWIVHFGCGGAEHWWHQQNHTNLVEGYWTNLTFGEAQPDIKCSGQSADQPVRPSRVKPTCHKGPQRHWFSFADGPKLYMHKPGVTEAVPDFV